MKTQVCVMVVYVLGVLLTPTGGVENTGVPPRGGPLETGVPRGPRGAPPRGGGVDNTLISNVGGVPMKLA